MKNKNDKKNIYVLGSLSIVVLLVFSYILCIYKTVVMASNSEINNKKIASLSANINKKEFEYISKVADIDLDKAMALGYVKNHKDVISYLNINNNELAVR